MVPALVYWKLLLSDFVKVENLTFFAKEAADFRYSFSKNSYRMRILYCLRYMDVELPLS